MKKQYDLVDYAAMAAISLAVAILFGSILVINRPKKETVEAPAPTTEAVEEETSATEATEATEVMAATEATAPVEVAVIVKEKAATKFDNKAIKKAEPQPQPQSTPMPTVTPTPAPMDPSSVPPAPEPPTLAPEPPRPVPEPRPAYNH